MKVLLRTYRLKGSDGYKVEEETVEIEKYGGSFIKMKYGNIEFIVNTQELLKALKVFM